jgi:hypothetical protein
MATQDGAERSLCGISQSGDERGCSTVIKVIDIYLS